MKREEGRGRREEGGGRREEGGREGGGGRGEEKEERNNYLQSFLGPCARDGAPVFSIIVYNYPYASRLCAARSIAAHASGA